MAGGIAAGIAGEGIRQLRAGKKPQLNQLVLTPSNARRLTSELSKMRGAAMKLGQLLSMEAGDLIPKEFSDILSKLRSDAHRMPPGQLDKTLKDAFGEHWRTRLETFEWEALAAASIGQVHRATSLEGRELALKIQYPGVMKSIDSDVNNLTSLLRTTGVIPRQMDIDPLIDEVKTQLKDEADYLKEAEYLNAFRSHLAHDERFYIPATVEELTTSTVLAMEYVEGNAIESLENAPLEVRNQVVSALLELLFHELFTLKLMQTDPNFANYRYNPSTQKIILLDFGACRHFDSDFVESYRQLLNETLNDNREGMMQALLDVGYDLANSNDTYRESILDIFALAGTIFKSTEPYAFANEQLSQDMQAINDRLMLEKNQWTPPPSHSLYLHRKLGGLLFLASRLKAEFPVRPLVEKHLKTL